MSAYNVSLSAFLWFRSVRSQETCLFLLMGCVKNSRRIGFIIAAKVSQVKTGHNGCGQYSSK